MMILHHIATAIAGLFLMFCASSSLQAQQETVLEDLVGAYASTTVGLDFSAEIRRVDQQYVLDICRNIDEDDCRSFPLMNVIHNDELFAVMEEDSKDINESFFVKVQGHGADALLLVHYVDGLSATLMR
ncbi:MAG: hypothetical protein AAF570_01405 [Bacteroidota bacterium]